MRIFDFCFIEFAMKNCIRKFDCARTADTGNMISRIYFRSAAEPEVQTKLVNKVQPFLFIWHHVVKYYLPLLREKKSPKCDI